MPALPRTICIWLLFGVLAFAPLAARAADRYVAHLADGTTLTSSRLATWPVPGSPIRWGERDLLADENPVRMLQDRQVGVELRPPYLLLANGDVLTGSPVQLAGDDGRELAAPRVKVQLEGMLPVTGTGVDVRTDRILRIVGSAEAAPRQPPPGTVQLADGRRIVARSIKWREYGLAMLTAEGIVEANYPEIVDAVFPDADRLAAVTGDNLWAGGTSAGTLARFQLAGGAIITSSHISREQERTRRRGRIGALVASYYYVQPAWAEQPIALPENEIAWCGYRAADQAPLSLLPAELAASRRLLGSGLVWQRNVSADGSLAGSGEVNCDLAISTHAHSEIVLDLPPRARSLTALVGIDRTVAPGGCVRCRVVAEKPGGRVLWDSGIVLGSQAPQATGPVDVAGLARVVLVTEVAHQDRPPGADPLDIRDQVVWLAPLVQVEFDPVEQLPAVLAGLSAWELSGAGLAQAQIASQWNARLQAWDPVLSLPKQSALALRRRLRIGPASDVIELRTACPDELDEHDFRLTVDGREVPLRPSAELAELRRWLHSYGRQRLRDEDDAAAMSDRLAYWWDLSPWRGRDVTVELVLRGKQDRNLIAWRGLSIRAAVWNLPDDGRPLAADVPLDSLAPQDVTSRNRRYRPAKDQLPDAKAEDPTIRFLGQPQTGGYSLSEESSVSFAVAPEYRRFVAVVGCAQKAAGPARVLVDGVAVWERRLLLALDPAEQIDVAIPAGGKVLTLEIGGQGAPYGYAAFMSAGFVTKP